MTDELSSEQEAAVRRLLAQARHDEPVPADVAARLDDVLEGLVADEGADDLEVFDSGSAPAGTASVTELAGARRRRRNAGRLLLAAAAVVLGGVAVGPTLGSTVGGDSDDSGSAADVQADAPREAGDTAAEQGAADSAGGATESQPQSGAASDLFSGLEVPVRLSSESFEADVRRELRQGAPDALRDAASSDFDGLPLATTASGFACADGAYGQGAKLPAYYDSEAAVLVLRRPQNGLQRVDLLTCGTAYSLNSVELPAP